MASQDGAHDGYSGTLGRLLASHLSGSSAIRGCASGFAFASRLRLPAGVGSRSHRCTGRRQIGGNAGTRAAHVAARLEPPAFRRPRVDVLIPAVPVDLMGRAVHHQEIRDSARVAVGCGFDDGRDVDVHLVHRSAAARRTGTSRRAGTGSGIMASRLSPGDAGLQLLENAAATAAALIGHDPRVRCRLRRALQPGRDPRRSRVPRDLDTPTRAST